MKNNALVINLFAGPGVGKSTTAARIFADLKMKNINCEMSLEFAKDKVWEESYKTIDDQIYIFGKQFHRLWRLKDKVDVIITDAPLPASIVYDKENSENFHNLIIEQFNKFNNLNFYIKRGTNYQESGRLQSEEDAKKIDIITKNVLDKYNIDYQEVLISEASNKIVEIILNRLR